MINKLYKRTGLRKIKENFEDERYAKVQVGMEWSDDEFIQKCVKIVGNKCWIKSNWNSLDSDKLHSETTVYNITKGDSCDILVDPKYAGEWYGQIYVNAAINLDKFYPDYWDIVLGKGKVRESRIFEDTEDELRAKTIAWFGNTMLSSEYNKSAKGRLQNCIKTISRCDRDITRGDVNKALKNLYFVQQELNASIDDLEKSIEASTPTNPLGGRRK